MILDIILRGGVLPVKMLSRSQLSVVEMLVEANFVRWKIDVDDDDCESNLSTPTEDKENPLAMFGREGKLTYFMHCRSRNNVVHESFRNRFRAVV